MPQPHAPRRASPPPIYPRARFWLRVILALVYCGVGLVHITQPDMMLPIVPGWVPVPRQVLIVTGFCEIAGAVGLFVPRWRRAAGWALALYAVCVFPANVKQALEGIVLPGIPDSWWYHGPRLALQPVIVWAALFAGGIVDWPFRKSLNSVGKPSATANL